MPAAGDECTEERQPVLVAGGEHLLRVELHGKDPAVAESFDNPVLRHGDTRVYRCEHFDRLVMERIDSQRIQPVDIPEESPFVAINQMGRGTVGGCLPVGDRARMLGREVLVQGPAGGDIHQLRAAADGQHGLVPAQGGAGIEQVAGVPPGFDLDTGTGKDSLPVTGGMDIVATGEKHAVKPREDGLHGSGIGQNRHNHRDAARLADRIDVGIRDDMGPAPADSRRHTDERCLPPGRKGQAQEGQQDGKAQLSLHFRMQ